MQPELLSGGNGFYVRGRMAYQLISVLINPLTHCRVTRLFVSGSSPNRTWKNPRPPSVCVADQMVDPFSVSTNRATNVTSLALELPFFPVVDSPTVPRNKACTPKVFPISLI